MRFDEVVAWTDAADFSAGTRSRRYIDWTRIIVRSNPRIPHRRTRRRSHQAREPDLVIALAREAEIEPPGPGET